jgi:hypothetical protein
MIAAPDYVQIYKNLRDRHKDLFAAQEYYRECINHPESVFRFCEKVLERKPNALQEFVLKYLYSETSFNPKYATKEITSPRYGIHTNKKTGISDIDGYKVKYEGDIEKGNKILSELKTSDGKTWLCYFVLAYETYKRILKNEKYFDVDRPRGIFLIVNTDQNSSNVFLKDYQDFIGKESWLYVKMKEYAIKTILVTPGDNAAMRGREIDYMVVDNADNINGVFLDIIKKDIESKQTFLTATNRFKLNSLGLSCLRAEIVD